MAQSSAVLTSLPELDAIRDDPSATWTREAGSNLDVLASDPDIAICQINSLLPFTYGDYAAVQFQFDDAAAIALAIQHLNTGDGRLVPEVEGLSDRCKIRFTVEFADTQYKPSVAVNQVVNITSRTPGVGRLPCGFVGAYRSAESIPTSILTGMWNYPQVSGVSTSAELDDKNQYPLFGRTIPSDHGNAVPIIQFMYDVLRIKHLAVLNINDAYGNSFVEGLRAAAEIYAPDMKIHQAPVDDGMAAIQAALASIKDTKYRYIFGIVFTEKVHDDVLSAAYDMGLAGTGKHQWLFADSFNSIDGRKIEANSTLRLAYRGVGMIEASGGLPGIGLTGFDNFLESVAEISNTHDMDYLFSKYPKYDNSTYNASIKRFTNYLTPLTSVQSTFVYEAAIALGLSACATVDEDFMLDGKKQYENMVNTEFGGITGKVVFDPATGSKSPLYTMYKVSNFLDVLDSETGMVQFEESYTHIYQEGKWRELTPFVFNDGTTSIPKDIPPVDVQDDTINKGVRVTVLLMCGLVLILGLGLMAWTHRHRKARVVLASQPFFLHIICVGAMVMVCTIIPLSIDHGLVESLQGCTKACIAVPWLGSMGFAMSVSALFTKTHRINIILNNANRLQRIKVTIWDVAKPMIFLLSVNGILLSLMTALAPPSYEMIVVNTDSFDRASEVRGQCNFSDSYAYVGSVCGVNLATLFLTIVQAVKARNLSVEFAESTQIFRALLAITIVMFVGGPVLLLSRDNANTFLFVASAIIFVTSASILLLLFVPKIRFWMISSKQKESRRVHISGIEMSRPNTPSYSVPNDSYFDEENADEIDSDFDTEEYTGLKILTTKTPEELVREVEALKRLLRKAKAMPPNTLKEDAIPDIQSIPIGTRLDNKASAASSTVKSILKKSSDLSQARSDDGASLSLGRRSDETLGADDYVPSSPQRSIRDDDSTTSINRERLESLREKREVAKLKFAALALIEPRADPSEASVLDDLCANGSMATAATSTSSSVPMVPIEARE